MLDLFRYEDEDGDELIARPSAFPVGDMMFHCEGESARRRAVRVPREKVEKLYSALGEWLYPTGVPKMPDLTGLTEAMSKASEGMAVAVQSLHLSPVAVVKVPDAPEPEPLCELTRPYGAHPATRCTFCGHLWTEHTPPPIEPEHHGRLMSVLPRRTRRCIECGHQADAHHAPTQGWDGGCIACSCAWGGPQ